MSQSTLSDHEKQQFHDRVSESSGSVLPCPSHTTEAKLLRKIDFRVLPFLIILYILAFLDRVNIANANVFGLTTELKLKGTQYNNALVIFFVPYILFEIPSNLLLKRLKPHVWLSLCMFGFGLVTLCQGLVRGYSGLLTTRFFLGAFESGMFPGCFYLIGSWYTRAQAQKRFSLFFCSTTLAGAFGGLLASAIGLLDGRLNYRGWRWIFIIEGAMTCVAALIIFWFIPSFPEEAKWLTEDERAFIKSRLEVDMGRSAHERKVTAKDVGRVFQDFKIFLGGFMYFGLIVPAYAYSYFAPGIIKSYGYSNIQTQLHSVPPWVCTFVLAMIVAYASDVTKHRFIFTLIPTCIGITGFGILLKVHHNRDLEYAALFLVAMGIYSAMPVTVCWFQMNVVGHHRKGVASAWQVAFGNIGGIIAVYAFLAKDAVHYYATGYKLCLGFCALSAASCIAYAAACYFQNRSRDRKPRDVTLTEFDRVEMGDLNPDFRYLL